VKKIIITASVIICFAFLAGFLIAKYQQDIPQLLTASNYKEFTDNVDKICPFAGTTQTSKCLDDLIVKKETELKNLIVELRNGTTATKEDILKGGDSDAIEWNVFLNELSAHEKSWEDYSDSFCGIKNSQIGGSAIVEESRKCRLFQIEQFIQLLNDQKDWVM